MTEEDPVMVVDAVVDAGPSDAVASSGVRSSSLPRRGCQRQDRCAATIVTTDIQARILDIIAGIIEINPESIRPDRLLVEYGLDSARVMDLIVALEDELGVTISDDVARSLRRVDDIVRFISSQVNS